MKSAGVVDRIFAQKINWKQARVEADTIDDRLTTLEAREKRVRELCAKLEAGVEWPMARKILAILDGDTE